jgi:hypothetical protein
MTGNHCSSPRVRQWSAGVGLAGAAAVAALMIELASAPVAAADTPDDVLGQAGQDVTQAIDALNQAPTTSLDAEQLSLLYNQESLLYNEESQIPTFESMQADLPAADQAGLADVDQGLLNADQAVLEATQTFVAADQAGDLTSASELALAAPNLETIGPMFDILFTDLGAQLFSNFGIPDIFLP